MSDPIETKRPLTIYQCGPTVRIPRAMRDAAFEDCEAIMGTRDLAAWIEEEVKRGLEGDDPTETPRAANAQKMCPSRGGERFQTYRIATTKAWQRRVPLAADLEGKYHDECDDCGYQTEIRSEP